MYFFSNTLQTECFETTQNRFEQFCINYSNEKVQNFCSNYLLRDEQNWYESEGIEIPEIRFPGNDNILGEYLTVFHCIIFF